MSLTAVTMALGWNFRRLHGIEAGTRRVRYAEILILLDLYEAAWCELTALEQRHVRDGDL